MLRKLLNVLLLLTAIVFAYVMVSRYVQKMSLNIARTEADYLHLVMALLMVLAGALAIRELLRERRIPRVESSGERPPAMTHERSFPGNYCFNGHVSADGFCAPSVGDDLGLTIRTGYTANTADTFHA
jgi:hypothetical protein